MKSATALKLQCGLRVYIKSINGENLKLEAWKYTPSCIPLSSRGNCTKMKSSSWHCSTFVCLCCAHTFHRYNGVGLGEDAALVVDGLTSIRALVLLLGLSDGEDTVAPLTGGRHAGWLPDVPPVETPDDQGGGYSDGFTLDDDRLSPLSHGHLRRRADHRGWGWGNGQHFTITSSM